MAAEVPVSDVLCEATEYLYKLGSNLRTRSENLKDKKIRKDKLRNAHAVQKAANKVLLICELSKKSLENVETGVRRVLSLIEQAQDCDGAKSSEHKKDIMKQYHYFGYDSHKLKIATKVSIKHYMSAKVKIRRMSESMQTKYPVYYDCKLFRQRKRAQEKLTSSRKNSLAVESDVNIEKKTHTNILSKSDDSNKSKVETEFEKLKKSKRGCRLDSSEKSEEDVKHHTKKSRLNSEEQRGERLCNEEQAKKNKENVPKRISYIDIYSSSESGNESQNIQISQINPLKSLAAEVFGKKENDRSESDNNAERSDSNKHTDDENNAENIKTKDKPIIRCVSLKKLLKPDAVISTTDLSQRKSQINKNAKKVSHAEKKQRRQSSSDNEFWAKKRKEVKEFKPKTFSIKVRKLPELSVNFLQSHCLTKIIQNGKVICEDVKNDENVSIKNALLNDSDSDENVKDSERDKQCENLNQKNQVTSRNKRAAHAKRALLSNLDSENENQETEMTSNEPPNDSTSANNDKEKAIELETTKQALLNDSDCDINPENKETVSETTKKSDKCYKNVTDVTKQALLKDSDSDENKNEAGHPKISVEVQKENSANNGEGQNNEEVNVTDKIKESLLHDSESENNDNESGTEKNNTNEKDNEQRGQSHDNDNKKQSNVDTSLKDELSPTKDPDNIKKSLLNDSSSNSSRSFEDEKKKRKVKLPRCKRRQAKANIYSSSSEDENDTSDEIKKKIQKHKRKKRISSSLSNEDIQKMKDNEDAEGKSSNHSDSETSNNASKASTSRERHDENSNSCVNKMVRSKAKPSGSSGQSSDNQDASDKDIDGLANLDNLHKTNRRNESSKNSNSVAVRKSSRSKPTPTIGTTLLSVDTSSEASDDVIEADAEELPPVKLEGLNGDGIEHLAKDDLLGESDSSGSHKDNNSEDVQANNESEEEESSVKLKRRKANAISSDSEGGTARRKKEDRVSDFEDSEDDNSEPAKKAKRKKQESDSDSSNGSNDGKKKRRRIKQVDSDASGSDTENEGRNKHGRKNIRKVMGKNQLEEATKKAAREEKERIARITERQKLYNNLEFDESGKPDEVVLDKVVLDFDPETKEPLIQVDRGLVKKLKPHQANGIKFMWDACFESVKRIKKDKGSGCILAHCMGLGKTLQVISLTHTLLTHNTLTGVNRVLVVCPLSTVLNWVNEFKMWLRHAENDNDVDVYELSRFKQNSERAFQLQSWFDHGGVCVLGYEMFRNLSADNSKKYKKKMLRSFQDSLVDPGPDLVVCDEGHLLKNEKTSLSQSMNRVKTRRRIVLTGTPLQNNLKEYYCMVQFVKPNLLGKYNEYLNRFVNPITNGQYTDSTEHDIRVMKRRSHVLHKMLDGAVQRRDYGVLAPFLPPKHEYVLFITLTDVQIKLYQHYLDNYSRRPLPGKSSGFLFPDFQSLQRIWTHPLVLKYNSERYEIMQQKKREREEEDSEGSLVDFIDDDSTPEETSTEESSDDSSELSDDSRKKSKKKKSAKKSKGKDNKGGARRGTRANPVELDELHPEESLEEVKYENPTEWWIKLVEEEELDDLRNSHKLVLLFDILRQCEAIGDKLLVFSQSLYSLDLIEHFLGKVDEATQEGRIDEKLGGHVGSWAPGVDYFRLDGSTSCENRSIWCKNFNREDNPRARLFLISTRAGGLGINLVAANRVVIFDVSWNPSHDVQSIFRVYRFGQKKPCYVYRFLAMGTMEEKIYERQVTKQAISKRVIDEQQIDRHYAENDLAELYKFEARPPAPRELPPLPKDRLFAEMLREHEAQIYKYHEHDSLLENKEEETLSEEERKAAWEDFENEKTRPPPAPFVSPWPMHNGMMPGLIAQQQQLAVAALAAMLRKDMPNINDNQIRDMIPLIYNSNPGLMQKMGEIYKYAQPGMMNPSMMNPINAGGTGSMGGSSGMQYEPPWQRQQQQQQQMRLQQLLQGQNQMAAQAKFYAGGLGSRDPVAMALQQQRAREIMMSGGAGAGAGAGAGRPRGRPPLSPRVPATHSQDVVNLDSD